MDSWGTEGSAVPGFVSLALTSLSAIPKPVTEEVRHATLCFWVSHCLYEAEERHGTAALSLPPTRRCLCCWMLHWSLGDLLGVD